MLDDHIAAGAEVDGRLVAHTFRVDDHRRGDIERKRDAQQRLQRVTLGAAGRATIFSVVGCQHGEVGDVVDGGSSDAGAVVGNGDERDVFVVDDGDLDYRCAAGRLGGVERVVEQLFDDNIAERVGGLGPVCACRARSSRNSAARGLANTVRCTTAAGRRAVFLSVSAVAWWLLTTSAGGPTPNSSALTRRGFPARQRATAAGSC